MHVNVNEQLSNIIFIWAYFLLHLGKKIKIQRYSNERPNFQRIIATFKIAWKNATSNMFPLHDVIRD
jgi:hypothetical protein